MADAILSERISRAPQIRAALFKRRNMVDVTGIEPVTPCLQSRREKTLKALSGVAYTENRRDFRSLKCPEIVPNFSNQRIALLSGHICATILASDCGIGTRNSCRW